MVTKLLFIILLHGVHQVNKTLVTLCSNTAPFNHRREWWPEMEFNGHGTNIKLVMKNIPKEKQTVFCCIYV